MMRVIGLLVGRRRRPDDGVDDDVAGVPGGGRGLEKVLPPMQASRSWHQNSPEPKSDMAVLAEG